MLTTADLFISGDRELCLSLLWLVGVYEQTDDYTWLLHAQTGECERRRKSLFSKKLSSIEIHASSSLCLQSFTSHHLVLRLRLLVTLVCIVNHFCAVFCFFFQKKFSCKLTGIDCVQYKHKKKTQLHFLNLVCSISQVSTELSKVIRKGFLKQQFLGWNF